LVSVFIPYLGNVLGWTKSLIGTIIVTIAAATIAIYGVSVILESTKKRKSFTFMPFGPALVFGGLIVMFWGNHVLNWYLHLVLQG
jgi:leader peptidase (prepilin peptidase) / N-methyltransferase